MDSEDEYDEERLSYLRKYRKQQDDEIEEELRPIFDKIKASDERFDELGEDLDLEYELEDLQETLKMVGESVETALHDERELRKETERMELEICGEQRKDFKINLTDLEIDIIKERKVMKEFEDRINTIDEILKDLTQYMVHYKDE